MMPAKSGPASGSWRRSIAIGATLLALAGCKPAETTAPAPSQPVQVIVAAEGQVADTWSYVGTIRARHESDLGFRVAGKIIARLVDIGQKVEPGQPVLRLDMADYQLAVEAQLADVRAAQSNREQAIAAEQRFKQHFAQGHVAKAALEQRQAVADEARSRSERAERSLSLARNQLAYTELKVDHAGVVTALPVEAGQVVTVGQPVLRLARLDALEAQVAIPENLLDAIRSASSELEVWGSKAKRLPDYKSP
jgi:membrane fusion protein, multidrug efflux system